MIPISQPELGPEVEALVLTALRSGQLSQGPLVAEFEALCADMAGTRHAIAVSNGTVSLELVLEALGVGSGDEVITTPLTFAATLNAILRSGARARFADVRADFTLDPESVDSLVNERTAAIIPVHLYGLPCDMAALMKLAERRGLGVIEDSAQAHGATVEGRAVGGFGIGSFSFYATKNVTSGEGGVITTSDVHLSEALRTLRNQGMTSQYQYETVGRNARLSDVQAAIAIPQLRRLDVINTARSMNAAYLTRALSSIGGVSTPVVPPGRTHVWHQYTVLLERGVERDAAVARLRAAGIAAGVYYPALVWDHEVYRAHPQVVPADTPCAADAAARCLSLPVHPALRPEALATVAEVSISVLTDCCRAG